MDDKIEEIIKHLENAEAQFKLAIEAAYKDGVKDGHDSLLSHCDIDECWDMSDTNATLKGCK